MLSLHFMLYFGENHQKEYKQCMQIFIADEYYFFALTCIHASLWTLDLIEEKHFDAILGNISNLNQNIAPFELFSEIVIKF